MRNTMRNVTLVAMAALSMAVRAHGAPPPPDDDDADLDHGSRQPWVDCKKRRATVAVDPLGPVVAHGVREAPGYRPGLLSPLQRAAFRRASLHFSNVENGLFYEDLELPSASPTNDTIAEVVAGAIELAGLRVPADIAVLERRDVEQGSREISRSWRIGFAHGGVAVSPGRCTLTVEAGRSSPAALSCRVPKGTTPLRFDTFRVRDEAALDVAVALTRVQPVLHDVRRLYVAKNGRAEARYNVVHYDGRREMLTVLDGTGAPIASGSNERAFTFAGYDPGYVSGFKTQLATPLEVGPNQTQVLDTAPLELGAVPVGEIYELVEKDNCPTDSTPESLRYTRGYAVCRNDLFIDPDTKEVTQPVVAPRADADYTNAAGGGDALGAQLKFFNADLPGSPPVHENLVDLTAYPTLKTPFEDYIRKQLSGEQPIGPGHHAELQLFHSVGKLQKYYALLDSKLSPQGQDRWRTELVAHWRPGTSGDSPGADDYGNAHAARYSLKFADFRSGNDPAGGDALDGSSDASLVAHEYHHHVQESLAADENWEVWPNQLDEQLLFPPPEVDTECSGKKPCSRRNEVLEGLADGFSGIFLGQAAFATISRPDLKLADLLSVCDNNKDYPYHDGLGAASWYASGVGPSPRFLCNSYAFGFWEEIQATYIEDGDACTRTENPLGIYRDPRRRVVSGAVWAYSKRLGQTYGNAIYGRHVLDAERGLQTLEDGEIVFGGALLSNLQSSPFASQRRYGYTARAALIEKGIFPPAVQGFLVGGDEDKRPIVRCEIGTPPCVGFDTFFAAPALMSTTLTMSGPFNWSSAAEPPEFDFFVVPGNAYASQVWVELSDNAAFDPAQGVVTQDPQSVPSNRINCSPAGFFRTKPTAASWQKVAESAQEDRVYYRVRECLAGTGPSGPWCVVSSTLTTPAYVSLQGLPEGCTCRVVGSSGSSPFWILALAAGGLLLVSRREAKRRR